MASNRYGGHLKGPGGLRKITWLNSRHQQETSVDYLILISTLGGLSVFGLNGFVIGPLVAALFMSSWALFVESKPRVKLPLP